MEKQFLFVDVANPTWLVYVSVLVLAVFFRFSRLFSVRNLDVLLILLLSTSLVTASAWKSVPPPELAGKTGVSQFEVAVQALSDGRNTTLQATPKQAIEGQIDLLSQDPGSGVLLTSAEVSTPETPVSAPEADKVSRPQFHPLYQWSSAALLLISVLLMVRLVFDESLTRRPRL